MERELDGKEDAGGSKKASKKPKKGRRLKLPKQKLDVITEDESETDSADVTSAESEEEAASGSRHATPMHVTIDDNTLRSILDLTSFESRGVRVRVATRDTSAMTSHASPVVSSRRDRAKDELRQRTKDRKRLYRP